MKADDTRLASPPARRLAPGGRFPCPLSLLGALGSGVATLLLASCGEPAAEPANPELAPRGAATPGAVEAGSAAMPAGDRDPPERPAAGSDEESPDPVAALLAAPATHPAETGTRLLRAVVNPASGLSAGERVDALRVALPLLDEDGLASAVDLAAAAETDDTLRAAVVHDLLAREPAAGLPGLVRLGAALEDAALRAAVRAELSGILGEDYGSNWSSWADAVDRHLEGLGYLPEVPAGEGEPASGSP